MSETESTIQPTTVNASAAAELTEDCSVCKGSGRRFRASAAAPNGGTDIGACPICNGTGRIKAEGVTHTPPAPTAKPANVTKESPSAKTEPLSPAIAVLPPTIPDQK